MNFKMNIEDMRNSVNVTKQLQKIFEEYRKDDNFDGIDQFIKLIELERVEDRDNLFINISEFLQEKGLHKSVLKLATLCNEKGLIEID